MNSFTSNWISIRHYSKITANDITPGIYIWGFLDNSKFMPYYVGKAWNIADRLCNHLANLKGGSYTVYTWEDLFNTEHDNRFYEPSTIEDRVAFVKGTYTNTKYNNNIKVEELVKKMVDNFQFTYVKMTPEEFAAHGSLAESTILSHLRKIIINTRIGKGIEFFDMGNIRLVEEKWLEII